jgi:hypothetical protein
MNGHGRHALPTWQGMDNTARPTGAGGLYIGLIGRRVTFSSM